MQERVIPSERRQRAIFCLTLSQNTEGDKQKAHFIILFLSLKPCLFVQDEATTEDLGHSKLLPNFNKIQTLFVKAQKRRHAFLSMRRIT
mmetsp:Transcript_3349/g.8670  ORF Transcript_3349/g.8670 Transcript_3349/m.8670 type:complete len:89 (+) Transcript_3349:2762-3028(+)